MNNKETIEKLNKLYIKEDCVQISIPYRNTLVLFSSTGKKYEHNKYSSANPLSEFNNTYLSDKRRKGFPYHDIPVHYENKYGFKMCYVNQILDYDKIYIQIGDGHIYERYVIKDGNDAYLITKQLEESIVKSVIVSRKELEELYYRTDVLVHLYEYSLEPCFAQEISKERKIAEYVKDVFMNNINLSNFTKTCGINKDISYYHKIYNNINIDMNKLEMTIPLSGTRAVLFPKEKKETNKTSNKIYNDDPIYIDTYFISFDKYEVNVYSLPIKKYTLSDIINYENKIHEQKDPKISPRLNPNIKKEDIDKAKRLVKSQKEFRI